MYNDDETRDSGREPQDNIHQTPPEQPPQGPPPPPVVRPQYYNAEPPRKKKTVRRVLFGALFGLSVLANIVLFLALVGYAAMGILSYDDGFREEILQPGPANRKIIVVPIEGMIDDRMSESIRQQMAIISHDPGVRAVIIQINSPGGGVAASDRIHTELATLRQRSGIPFVAYMRDLGASGGYYTAVACDRIIAEPTTVTGSIGVIMSSFVVKELLEDKLGIEPVIVKAGERKDWPNPFDRVTPEQREYLYERLIEPAYERFVSVVVMGRSDLTEARVRELADGSLYSGVLAQEVGLVDQVGYLGDAVETAMELAGIRDAKVIRYREPFRLTSLLFGGEAKSLLRLSRSQLHELAVPELMYLWQ